MKITNCLRVLLTLAFVVGILSSTHAGQKGVVLSPDTGEVKVEPNASKVTPGKMVPKKEDLKVVPGSKKKLDLGKQPQKPTLPVKCNGRVVTILGTSGVDFLNGTPGDDVIHGLGGNDIIRGMGGNDTICGGEGDDKLDGGKGNDTLDGGPGRDECTNGPSGSGFLVAPKNCENNKFTSTAGISPKTQRKPGAVSGGFVPNKPAKKAQLEKQKQSKAKKKAVAAQQDNKKQGSDDTSLGKATAKPYDTVEFKTHLSVKLPSLKGDQWGTEYNETEWMVLKFRWWTPKGVGAFHGEWQVSTSPKFNTILADGDAGKAPELGKYQWFHIDFKNIKQYTFSDKVHATKQNVIPDKVHVTKQSASPGKVHFSKQDTFPDTLYVRVVPSTESEQFTPSPIVTVSIVGAADFHFKLTPRIDSAVGSPGRYTNISPDGILYIEGIDFGEEKGDIFLYGIGFPDGRLPLDPVVWESNSRVNGRVPHVTGIKDQQVEVEVVTKNGLVSNRHKHMFLGIRETKVLGPKDAAVKVDQCGREANVNICNGVAQWTNNKGTLMGIHRNANYTIGDDEGWDHFKIHLKNGWNIIGGKFYKKILTSDNETIDDPTPQWKVGQTLWKPRFHWVVSPGDKVAYSYQVTIEGPMGVPHY